MPKTAYGKRKDKPKRTLRRAGVPPAIHCMMIPVEDATLLLPTSVTAEVIDCRDLLPIEAAPPWLFGQVEWTGRQVPVFDFSALINGGNPAAPAPRARLMVLKTLGDSSRMPYIGLLLSGLPRPVTVEDGTLEETGDERKALGVFSRVRLNGEDAIVPDLDRLSHLVRHAAFGALPITRLEH